MSLLLAESYFHRLDSVVLPIYGDLKVRWYGLSYIAGFVIAWLFVYWCAATKRSPLDKKHVSDLMFAVIIGVLVGGRLGHVIFYGHGVPLITFTDSFPWWEVLAINRGGMSAHGGILGVIAACLIMGRRYKVPGLHLLDMGALSCCGGLGLGRIANFINGELWGKHIPYERYNETPWWSIKYPEEIFERWVPAMQPDADPDALRRAADDLNKAPESIGVVLEKRLKDVTDALDETVGASDRFLGDVVAIAHDASHAAHAQVVDLLTPMLTPYYPSQIFQAITDGLILPLFLALIWLKPRQPGVVGCWFLIGYGALRIATEVFRQPDEGVALLAGLSRGQVLSVGLIVGGAIGLAILRARPRPPLGGLLQKMPA